MMKKSLLAAVAVAATAAPFAALADVSFNVGAVSDYRYRGISQTRLKPALQGGADWSHESGFYLGAWASNVKWLKDVPGGKGDVEIDIYGGYKGEITKGLGYDVGLLQYWYPGNNLSPSANTTEIYGALTYGPATLKYSHSLTNTFAWSDSKNSNYLDLSATFEAPWGLMITPHIGHQKIAGTNSGASYTDYSVTVAKEVSKGLTVSLAAVGTDADKAFYTAPNGKFLGKTSAVLGLKYSF